MDLQKVVIPLGVVGGGGRAGGLEGVPGQRVHGDLGGRERTEALEAHRRGVAGMRRVCGAGGGAWAAPVSVTITGDSRYRRALEVVGRTRPNSKLSMAVDEHVHGQDAHHLGHDERQGTEVERPAVGVAVLLRVAFGGVPRVGWYVHDDPDDVAQAWGMGGGGMGDI